MAKRKLATENRRKALLKQMRRDDTGIISEGTVTPLIGHLAMLQSLLWLYRACQQGDAPSSLGTRETAQAIESALLETVSRLTSTGHRMTILTPGLMGYRLTTVFEVPFDLDDISCVEMRVEELTRADE